MEGSSIADLEDTLKQLRVYDLKGYMMCLAVSLESLKRDIDVTYPLLNNIVVEVPKSEDADQEVPWRSF